ncbi:MAG: hypothetical protein HFJ85_00890 [Oscillospiraceae bacterium]|nr:hypothetical protein [Oscillospiraceae bacterium]
MNALTKKHIIVAVILAVLGIVTVLLLLQAMKGNPISTCIFEEDGTEYTGDYYQMDDAALTLEDGTELQLELITYFPEQKELQFGFSLPEADELKNKEPFKMELLNLAESADSPITKEPFYISELRDGRYHYRAVFRDAQIDVERSPDLTLRIKSTEGTPLSSEVFITAKTLFTAKPFSQIDSSTLFRATLGSGEEEPSSKEAA